MTRKSCRTPISSRLSRLIRVRQAAVAPASVSGSAETTAVEAGSAPTTDSAAVSASTSRSAVPTSPTESTRSRTKALAASDGLITVTS